MLNFHKFLHTMYTCVVNSVVKNMTLAENFDYYAIILVAVFSRGHSVFSQ